MFETLRNIIIKKPIRVFILVFLAFTPRILDLGLENAGFVVLVQSLETESEIQARQSEKIFRYALARLPDDTSSLRGLGFALLVQGEEDQAIMTLQRADFPVLSTFKLWGNHAMYEGRDEIALMWYKRALKVDDHQANIWYRAGLIHRRNERKAEAINAFEKAYHFGNADGVILWAWLLHQQGDYAAAIDVWRRALAEFPQHPERLAWWQGLVNSLRASKQWATMVNVSRRALREFPEDSKLYFGLGQALYYTTDDLDEAKSSLIKAIELDSELAGAYGSMGDILASEQSYEEAYIYYTEALKYIPEHKEWLIAQANMARASGRLTEAIDLYEQIIDRFPDYALAYHELALAFRLSSQSVDAVNVMEQALQLTSPRVDFYLRAGAIYEYVQDDSMALEMFRCALQLDPDNDLAQEAIKRIRGD